MTTTMQGPAGSSHAGARPSPRDLSDWLVGHGRHWVTTEEVSAILGIPLAHVPPTLARLRRQGKLFSPARGAYVPIPPEYRAWGTVPADHFVDSLMRHLGHSYYVGLMSAAQAYGVAHQQPMVFQVITDARVRPRTFGRVRMEFIVSAETATRAAIPRNTPTGTMRVGTVETTALDLVSTPHHGGGISNVATILGEMVEEGLLDSSRLATAADGYAPSVVARLGWIIEFVAGRDALNLDELAERLIPRTGPTLLAPENGRRGATDPRWNVLVNIEVEPDL